MFINIRFFRVDLRKKKFSFYLAESFVFETINSNFGKKHHLAVPLISGNEVGELFFLRS